MSDAISRIKRFSLYNEIPLTSDSHSCEATPTVLPSQENLEVPIFDRDVTWHVNYVNTEIPHGFMLNDTWYEIEDNTPVPGFDKPNNNGITKMTAPAVQLKLSTAQL